MNTELNHENVFSHFSDNVLGKLYHYQTSVQTMYKIKSINAK